MNSDLDYLDFEYYSESGSATRHPLISLGGFVKRIFFERLYNLESATRISDFHNWRRESDGCQPSTSCPGPSSKQFESPH